MTRLLREQASCLCCNLSSNDEKMFVQYVKMKKSLPLSELFWFLVLSFVKISVR